MKNLKCLFGIHSFTIWRVIGEVKYGKKLSRTCIRCGKNEIYEGMIQTDIETGESSPYIFKD